MIATVAGLTYTYPDAPGPALEEADAAFSEGELTLLCGPSGGGKSTLLRALNGLVPQFCGGAYSGKVTVDGLDAAATPARRMANLAGMVFQEPESQAIAEHVEEEISFGMEQQGIPRDEMLRRCDRLLRMLGIEHLRHRSISTLSGGERQRVAIASVLALEPRMLLLDEPTSQLDPAGAESVIDALAQLSASGLAIVVAEHRLDRLLPHAHRITSVENAHVHTTTVDAFASAATHGPPLVELARRLELPSVPLSIPQARRAIAGLDLDVAIADAVSSPGTPLLAVDALSVHYGDFAALAEASFTLHEGEIIALVGANGSGKSTLLRTIAGVVQPTRGDIRFSGKPAPPSVSERTAFAGLVPQDPAFALYRDTVLDELRETLRLRRAAETTPESALDRWNLHALGDRNPRDLSVGQQQRVAIGAMLAHAPRVWMLDEPTRGADVRAKEWLAEALRAHAADGGAVVVATHDIESAASFATRVIGLEAGRISFDLPVRDALGSTGPMPTQTAQLVPGALLPQEVIRR